MYDGPMPVLTRVEGVPRVRRVLPPYQQIAHAFIADIRAHRRKPGDVFPSVAKIAEDWGVATSTAQRVIEHLRAKGWVRTEHGRATYVADQPPP